jgi:hypothetical protein
MKAGNLAMKVFKKDPKTGKTVIDFGSRGNQNIRRGANILMDSTPIFPHREAINIARSPYLLHRQNVEPFKQAAIKTSALAAMQALGPRVAPLLSRIPRVGAPLATMAKNPIPTFLKGMAKPKFIGASAGLGAGIGKLTGQDPMESAIEAGARAPALSGLLNFTQPMLRLLGPGVNAMKNPAVRGGMARLMSGGANVAEGVVLDRFMNRQTTPSTMAVDAFLGALMPGQIGYVGKQGRRDIGQHALGFSKSLNVEKPTTPPLSPTVTLPGRGVVQKQGGVEGTSAQRLLPAPASETLKTSPSEALDKSVPFVDHKLKTPYIKEAHKNPDTVRGFVAMRKTKAGKEVPAIRKESGIFAPKEVETHTSVDLKGKTLQSYNLRDALFEADNITKEGAAKVGYGPGSKLWIKTVESLVDKEGFVAKKASFLPDVLRRHNIKQTKQNMILLGEVAEGKVKNPPKNFVAALEEIRPEWDASREIANTVRSSLNKKEIGYQENYFSHMRKTGLWGKVVEDKRTRFIDNFDYIIPNEIVNPTAYKRTGKMQDYEKRFDVVWDAYHNLVANDIYTSPTIEQLKAHSAVYKSKGLHNLSKVIEKVITYNYAGKPAEVDALIGLQRGSKGRIIIGGINRARAVAALGGNPVWTTFVQPLSYPGMAMPQTGGLKYGIQNTVKGIYRYFTDRKTAEWVESLPAYKLKAGAASIGKAGAGDVDITTNRAAATRIDKANDVVNLYANWMERTLSKGAGVAALEEANRLGMKEADARIFANYVIESSQSAYNKEARPLLLNNVSVRFAAPFQTFSFELYRYTKRILGRGGGMPVEKSDRLNQGLAIIAAMLVTNELQQKAIGRKSGTVGSFVPLAQGYVDARIADVTRIAKKKLDIGDTSTFGTGAGRAPLAPMQDIETLFKAFETLVEYNSFTPLRKELVKWGMGFSGIAGASTVNRFIDGMIANTQGYQKTRSGLVAFPVEGKDKLIAPILGPYSTSQGKQYIQGKISHLGEKQSEHYQALSPEQRKARYGYLMSSRSVDKGITSIAQVLEQKKYESLAQHDPRTTALGVYAHIMKADEKDRRRLYNEIKQSLTPEQHKHVQTIEKLGAQGLSQKDLSLALYPPEQRALALFERLDDLKPENRKKKYYQLKNLGLVTPEIEKAFIEILRNHGQR